MPTGATEQFRALRKRAERMFVDGASVRDVMTKLGVSQRTAYYWRSGYRPPAPGSARRRLIEMVRAEATEVIRVLLDNAKGGDVRAATLVVRLLEKAVGEEEAQLDDLCKLTADDLERELRSLPAAIASEIVGLLAQAGVGAEGPPPGPDPAEDGEDGEPGHLPWKPRGDSSDQGEDPL